MRHDKIEVKFKVSVVSGAIQLCADSDYDEEGFESCEYFDNIIQANHCSLYILLNVMDGYIDAYNGSKVSQLVKRRIFDNPYTLTYSEVEEAINKIEENNAEYFV